MRSDGMHYRSSRGLRRQSDITIASRRFRDLGRMAQIGDILAIHPAPATPQSRLGVRILTSRSTRPDSDLRPSAGQRGIGDRAPNRGGATPPTIGPTRTTLVVCTLGPSPTPASRPLKWRTRDPVEPIRGPIHPTQDGETVITGHSDTGRGEP